MASPPSPHKEERAILEAIRQGKAPTIVKRQASRGTLPVDAEEMVEILVFLTHDPDPTCSGTAKQTLAGWPPEKIAAALAQPEASAEILAYFAAQKDLPESLLPVIAGHANAGDEALVPLASRLTLEQIQSVADDARLPLLPQFVAAVLARPDLPAELRGRLEALPAEKAAEGEELAAALAREEEEEAKAEPEKKRERISLTVKVARMSVSERVQLALKGTKDERMLLVRDPSKVVYRAVLQSPKLSDGEVENFATMKNIAEEALRIIAGTRKFMKRLSVARNLVNNPRTPIDVSIPLLNRIPDNELKTLGGNRNVPDTVRAMAFKLYKQRTDTRKGGGGGH
jgi:hypothetical protein